MDILYYSNYCKHSQKTLQFFIQNNLTEKVNFICVDKRRQDSKTGQIYVFLENGTQVLLPPNVHSVPALLLVKQSYSVVLGDNIMSHYQSDIKMKNEIATQNNGEPIGISLGSMSSFSSVNIQGDVFSIYTPPDQYKPNKLSSDITIDSLQKSRNDDLSTVNMTPSFLPQQTQGQGQGQYQ